MTLTQGLVTRAGTRRVYVVGCAFFTGSAAESNPYDERTDAEEHYDKLRKDPTVQHAYLRTFEVVTRMLAEETSSRHD